MSCRERIGIVAYFPRYSLVIGGLCPMIRNFFVYLPFVVMGLGVISCVFLRSFLGEFRNFVVISNSG